jgi:Holliday junction resolvase
MDKFIEDGDLQIDDVITNSTKKKRKNSKKKGNRGELELAKLLTKHFGETFSRSVGSGNRWGQVANLPSHAKDTLLGDLCCPVGFKFVLECKDGYEDKTDMNGILESGLTQLDAFIAQSEHDELQSGRQPIVLWKRARKPWVAMIRDEFIKDLSFDYMICYRNWRIIDLEKLLELTTKEFWFK